MECAVQGLNNIHRRGRDVVCVAGFPMFDEYLLVRFTCLGLLDTLGHATKIACGTKIVSRLEYKWFFVQDTDWNTNGLVQDT